MTMQTNPTTLNDILIVPSSAQNAKQMEALMYLSYGIDPDNPEQVFSAAMFRHQIATFPEGQFSAMDGDLVVGFTASMRMNFDPVNPFIEPWWTTIGEGWLRHVPDGEWMYGVESCVHPDMRGRGVGGKLMEARFNVAKRLNLRGMVAGSAIISYHKVADHVSVEDYIQGVVEGKYFDENLSKQIKKGFRPAAPIPNYLLDMDSLGWGVIIVWDNPDYKLE